ncbi:hypothetical protein LR48_Vigan11g124000 [Vigna angularis]|uniref:Uncharacterized protein n=1 Tax=Phaseolus angularis TaxID=3914 RepID=A0A0L9VSZ5_PHAAN|nr:hypothetical protein LR48_Vigan11g124000 [Vigna angularis]
MKTGITNKSSPFLSEKNGECHLPLLAAPLSYIATTTKVPVLIDDYMILIAQHPLKLLIRSLFHCACDMSRLLKGSDLERRGVLIEEYWILKVSLSYSSMTSSAVVSPDLLSVTIVFEPSIYVFFLMKNMTFVSLFIVDNVVAVVGKDDFHVDFVAFFKGENELIWKAGLKCQGDRTQKSPEKPPEGKKLEA